MKYDHPTRVGRFTVLDTALAVLRLLDQVERHGEAALRVPVRTHAERTLRVKAS